MGAFYRDNQDAMDNVRRGDADDLVVTAIDPERLSGRRSRASAIPRQPMFKEVPFTSDMPDPRNPGGTTQQSSASAPPPSDGAIRLPSGDRLVFDPYAGNSFEKALQDLSKPPAANAAQPTEQGFIAGSANALLSGAGSTARGVRAGLNTITGDNTQVEVIAKDQMLASKKDPLAQQAFQENLAARMKLGDDGLFDAIKNLSGAIWDNPEGAYQTILSQAPNSLVALGAGYVGAVGGAAAGSALAGAAAGSVVPGVGTAIGGTIGLIAGLFGANALLETGGKAIERGMDGSFTDAERRETLKEGAVKGAVITGVDALTLGGSRWILNTANRAVETATARALGAANIDADALGKSITAAQKSAFEATAKQGREASQAAMTRATAEVLERAGANSPGIVASVRQAQSAAFESVNTFAQKVGRGTGAVALESVGEGVGEYLGELAATGKASPTEAALEALAGLGMSVGELAGVSAKLTSPGTLTRTVGGTPSESDLVGNQDTRDITGLNDFTTERNRYDLTKALAKKPEETISTLAAIFKTESELTDEGKAARANILATVDRLGIKDQFNIYLNDTNRVQDGLDILNNAPALREDTIATAEQIAQNIPAANAGPTTSQSESMQEFADQTDPMRLADNTTPLVVGSDPILLQFMSNTTGSGGKQTFGSQYQVLPINQQTFDDYLQTANGNNYSDIQEFLDDNMLGNGTVAPTHVVVSRGLANQSNGTGNFEFRGVGTKNSIENYFNDQSRRKYFTPVRTFNNDVSNLFGKIDDASPEGAKSYVNKRFKLSQEALAKEQDEQRSAPAAAQQTRLPEEHSALLSEINYQRGKSNLPVVASQDVSIQPLPDYLKQIGDLFSVRLIGFKGTADYYGLSSGSSNKIYINVDKLKKVSGLWILGHEVWHQLETRNPAMASKVAQDLVAYMRDEKFNEYSAKLLSLGYSKSDINSEIAGDLMGLVFNDRQFWEGVEAKNPSLVSKVKDILDRIIDKLAKFLGKAEGRYGRASRLGGYLKDYKAARDLLADIAAKLATAPRQSASATGPSAAMADDESNPGELAKGAIKQAQDSASFSKSEKGNELETALSEMSDDEREAYLEAKLPNKQLVAAIDAVMLDLAKKGEGRSLNDLSDKLMKRMYSSKEFFFHSRRVTRSMLANSWQKLPLALRTPSTPRQISEWISAPQRAEEEEAKVADKFEPAGTYKKLYSKPQKVAPKAEQVKEDVASSAPAKRRKSRIDLLRDKFESGLRNLTNIRYLDETRNLIQKRISEISEEILELNRVKVEENGEVTVYQNQTKDDESPMLWASRKETEYDFDTKVAGYSGEALSKKDALLLEYAQLKGELDVVRDSSLFSALASSDRKLAKTEKEARELRRQETPESERQARLYRLSISRLTDELFKLAEKEIEDGANQTAVRNLWNEYYPQLTFLSRYEASVLADRVKEMERERADANELLSGEREPAREPTQYEFLASLGSDLLFGKISIPDAMVLIDKAAARGELKDKPFAIRSTLIDLVGELAFVNDDNIYSERLNQIIAWAGAASREGVLTFADYTDIFHMQGVDIPASASANTLVAVSTRMTDHLAKVGNDYPQRDGWFRSMDQALSFNPNLLNIGLFTEAEKAGYEAWKEDRASIKTRRIDKGGRTLEQAFPDALFMEHTLAEMKDPTKLSKRDQARLSLIPDLVDAYFADIYHVVDVRPDLAPQVYDHISAAEKQEFTRWIDRKWKSVELAIEMAARAESINTLLQLPAMPDDMLSTYRTQLIRASALTRPEILQNAIDSARAIMNPESAPQGGTIDPDTGEILPFGRATEAQLFAETLESLRNLGMMRAPIRSNNGKKFIEDIGFDESGDFGLADPNSPRISIERFESDRGQIGSEDLSSDDLINSGQLDPSLNDDDASVESDDESDSAESGDDSRAAQGVFVGVMANRLVNDYVAEITASWANAPQIVVLANHLDLPQELRDEVAQKLQDGMGAKGLFDPRTGITYLFSDYLSSKEDTQWTIFHEIYGHLGMRAFQGAGFDSFLESMYRANADVRAQADARVAQGGIGKLEAIDEVLADMAADTPEAGVVKQWVGQIIAGLRKAGFDRLANFMGNMTNAELAYSLSMAKRYAQNGGYSPLQSGPRDVRLAQAKAPWEIFTMVHGNVKAFARYNPLLDEWYLFEATGQDIRDGSMPARTFPDQDAVTHYMAGFAGRIEKRTRSGFFRPGKIPSDLVTFNRREDESFLVSKLRNALYFVGQSFLPVYTIMNQAEKMGRMSSQFDLRKYLRLYERKTADRVSRFNQTFVYPIFDLLGQAKKAKGTYAFQATNVYEMLNKFLLAQHAVERNNRVNTINPLNTKGSGMTSREAGDILTFVASQPYGQAFQEIGNLLDRMSDEKIDGEERAGLLTRAQADMRRLSYKHYRNLSGINPRLDPDFSDDPSLGTGRLFNARSKERRAMGRGDEAPDILARTILGGEASIIRQEKNGIAQRVLAFFETNYDPSFLTINKQAQTRVISPATGFVEIVDDTSHYNDPTVMVARVRGIPVTMQFKEQGYGSFGEAIHGRVVKEPSALMNVVNQLTRFVGSAVTVYNPAWAAVNAIKDVQTLFLNSAVDGTVKTGVALKMIARLPLAIYSSLYGQIMELQPTSAIGKRAKAGVLKIVPHTVGMLRDLDEAKRAGAITSFINREGLEDQIIKIHEAINGKSVASRVKGLLKFIELLTVPIEQGPRLAAYTTLRKEGWTQTDAAVYSGKVTVDFNARGQNEALRQAYIFFNPAVQGTVGMVELARKNPARFAVAAGALTFAGFMIGMMTRAAAGDDDDDENGKNVLDELPTSKRATSVIVKPETAFGAFPLAYGWNFFYAAGVFTSDSVVGKTPVATTVARIVQSFMQAFSPLGGNSGFDAAKVTSDPAGQALRLFTPFVLTPVMQWYMNTNRFGGPLYPDSDFSGKQGMSDVTKTFRGVNPVSKDFAEWLQNVTGGSRLNKEGIDINPALIDHLIQSYVPGLASDIYKATGKSIRFERGEKIPRMESGDVSSILMSQVADRFAAYPSEGKDAQSFRAVKEQLEAVYSELQKLPFDDPRRKQIIEEHKSLGTAVAAIKSIDKVLRAENSTLNTIESQSYVLMRAGKIEESMEMQARAVQFENRLKETKKVLYARANKTFVKAGFQDLVLSTD